MDTRPFSLCVYCGSRAGHDSAHAAAARTVGRLIGERGWRLVYGGGQVGLMGIVADAALAAGAPVVGVIPQDLLAREVGHRTLTELLVTDTMHQRKQAMAERADAFLALPGGIGTFEELFEVWTWRQLGHHDQPVGLLNVAGYYDGLLGFLRGGVDGGFFTDDTLAMLTVDHEPASMLTRLHAQAVAATRPDDYRRT